MAINERLVHTASAAAGGGTGNQEEGLILHLDANDVDSYDGDGGVWYDIKDHEYTPSTNVSEHFNTVLYTGNDANNRDITGVGFQPNLVWIKNRDAGYSHMIYDSIRGATGSGGDHLSSDTTGTAGVVTGLFNSFDADGFSINKGTSSRVNQSSQDYVAWCFKAGGAAVPNTDGSITSQVSVNNDLGFSVVKYTGAASGTVGHGLDVTPEFIITKSPGVSSYWQCYHKSLGKDKLIQLNSNGLALAISNYWGTSGHTPSVFNLSTNSGHNPANGENIAYCFTSKRGVSKVGSFEGTGAAGNKVYTGFEPAFVMWKNADNGASNSRWFIFDNQRGASAYLMADSNSIEGSDTSIQFHRDGFTVPNAGAINNSGQTHIYYAVAKNTNETSLIPLKDEFTAGSVETTDLELNLDANSYSGSGDWLDGTSNYNNGTISGATYVNDGNADYFSFDGSNDDVSMTYSSTGLSGVTWESWMYLTSTGAYEPIGAFSVNGGNVVIYSNDTSSDVNAGYYDYVYLKNTKLLNQWNHIAITFTGWASSYSGYGSAISANIYFNGEFKNTVSVTPYGQTSAYNTIYRLMGNVTTYRTGGRVGQHRFYEAALTAAQIKSNYEATKIYNLPSLELHLDAASFDGSTNTPTAWTDSSSNSNNGTITGATFDSELGNYLNFDGNSDAVTTTYDAPTGAKTLEVWFNAASSYSNTYQGVLGGDNEILWIGGNLTSGYPDESIYWYQNPSELGIMIRDGEGQYLDDKWHHLTIVDTGSAHKMYLDGEERSFTYSYGSASVRFDWDNLVLGRGYRTNGADDFTGEIGQVRVYSSALTQEQIRQNYNFTKSSYPNGNDVTVSSSQFLPSSVSFDFNSTSNVTVNSSSIPANVYTICCWFNADVLSTAGLVSWGDAGTNYERRSLIIWNGGSGGFKLYSSTYASNIGGSTTLTTGTWYHGAITMDNGSCKIYLNGTEDGSGTNTLADYISPTLYVGRTAEASEKFDGKISDVKVFNKVLTPTEIVAQAAIGYNGIG